MIDSTERSIVAFSPYLYIQQNILEKREKVFRALANYQLRYARTGQESAGALNEFRVQLQILFLEIHWMVRRYYIPNARTSETDKKKWTEFLAKLNSRNYSDNLTAFSLINKVLDAKGLTKLDTRSSYDVEDAEAENEAHGL